MVGTERESIFFYTARAMRTNSMYLRQQSKKRRAQTIVGIALSNEFSSSDYPLIQR